MTTVPQLAGQPSAIFGARFSYPFDGKAVFLEFSRQFAKEFNAEAVKILEARHGADRAAVYRPLTVTSAYPTTKEECPRITVRRMSSPSKPSGIGLDTEERIVVREDGTEVARTWASEIVEDTIEISICTINERLRDDLFIWYRQYLIDAVRWALPQLRERGFYGFVCVDAADSEVEYVGTAAQPGFQFYTAQIIYKAEYELSVFSDVDQLKTVINWEEVLDDLEFTGVAGEVPDQIKFPER